MFELEFILSGAEMRFMLQGLSGICKVDLYALTLTIGERVIDISGMVKVKTPGIFFIDVCELINAIGQQRGQVLCRRIDDVLQVGREKIDLGQKKTANTYKIVAVEDLQIGHNVKIKAPEVSRKPLKGTVTKIDLDEVRLADDIGERDPASVAIHKDWIREIRLLSGYTPMPMPMPSTPAVVKPFTSSKPDFQLPPTAYEDIITNTQRIVAEFLPESSYNFDDWMVSCEEPLTGIQKVDRRKNKVRPAKRCESAGDPASVAIIKPVVKPARRGTDIALLLAADELKPIIKQKLAMGLLNGDLYTLVAEEVGGGIGGDTVRFWWAINAHSPELAAKVLTKELTVNSAYVTLQKTGKLKKSKRGAASQTPIVEAA